MNLLPLPHRYWLWITLIVLATIIVLSAFWSFLPETWRVNESSDYLSFYQPVAQNLLHGQGLRLDDGTPATTYPPGFPLILAAIMAASESNLLGSLNWMRIFVISSMVISALLLFSIGLTLYPASFAFIAVLLWLTYPLTLWNSKQPNSEVAFFPFFLGAVALFWRAIHANRHSYLLYLAAGGLAGLAMLIRPAAVGLGILFALLLLFWRRQTSFRRWLVPASLILLGNILVILPWLIWLYQQTGHFVLLSTNGPDSIRDGLTFAVYLKGYREPLIMQHDVKQLMQDFLHQAPLFNSLQHIVQAWWAAFMASPLPLIKLMLWKAARSWYATDSHRFEGVIFFIQSIYLFFISIGAFIAWRREDIPRQAVQMFLFLTLYFWLITTMVLSIVRYMMPVMALLILMIPFVLFYLPLKSDYSGHKQPATLQPTKSDPGQDR